MTHGQQNVKLCIFFFVNCSICDWFLYALWFVALSVFFQYKRCVCQYYRSN